MCILGQHRRTKKTIRRGGSDCTSPVCRGLVSRICKNSNKSQLPYWPISPVIFVLKNPTHCPSFRPFGGSWGSPGFLMWPVTSLQAGGWWAHLYRGLRVMRLGPNPQVPDTGETTLSNAAKSPPVRFTWSFFKLLLVNLLYLLLNSCICWVILEVATEYVFSFIPSIFCESGKAIEPINCLYSL